jgi:hypothetical protein
MEMATSTTIDRARPQGRVGRRPKQCCPKVDLVPAKNECAALDDGEFQQKIEVLKRLHERTYKLAGGAILEFAVQYMAVYKTVARDREKVDRLNKAFHLDYAASTRLRTIAAESKRLEAILKDVPSALEPLYEVTLALKADECAVRKAIERKRLTPESTLREVRALRQPVNVIGTVLKGREIRGGTYDSKVSLQALKHLVFHLTFPQGRVLRPEEVAAFRQKVEAVLRGTFAVRCVEVGVLDVDGDWKGPADLSRYLGTYWKLKDEAEALKQKVEAQAAAAVAVRKNMTPIEREQALREARQEAWKPFQERRKQIEDQVNAVFATAVTKHAYKKAVGDE